MSGTQRMIEEQVIGRFCRACQVLQPNDINEIVVLCPKCGERMTNYTLCEAEADALEATNEAT